MKEVLENVYQLILPLAGSPLRESHVYLVKGRERSLLIDTAFNNDECEAALAGQLQELGVDLPQVDIFVTHLHVDHCGLISRIKRPENTVYASPADGAYIDGFQQPRHWQWLTLVNEWSGVPPEHALKPEDHVAYKNRPSAAVPMTELRPGARISYGDYALEVIDLAGHTPGQIGLWHRESRTLFCGDHILERISPNISAWDLENDYVTIFCDNLRKVRSMPVSHLFATHGPQVEDVNGRIDDLVSHHQKRLASIEGRVAGSSVPVTAFEAAQDVEWSTGKNFFELPPQQKWFACSETMAHLQTLLFQGKLRVEVRGETRFYSHV
jgi:glyoxylase-like metal-dependent hydrolase (beta-lactamase superfamily II)